MVALLIEKMIGQADFSPIQKNSRSIWREVEMAKLLFLVNFPKPEKAFQQSIPGLLIEKRRKRTLQMIHMLS